jgi:hypothetical protein
LSGGRARQIGSFAFAREGERFQSDGSSNCNVIPGSASQFQRLASKKTWKNILPTSRRRCAAFEAVELIELCG